MIKSDNTLRDKKTGGKKVQKKPRALRPSLSDTTDYEFSLEGVFLSRHHGPAQRFHDHAHTVLPVGFTY
jgi:hypothetical protein